MYTIKIYAPVLVLMKLFNSSKKLFYTKIITIKLNPSLILNLIYSAYKHDYEYKYVIIQIISIFA